MSRSKWKPRILEFLAGLTPRTPLPDRILQNIEPDIISRIDGKTCPYCLKSFNNKRSLIIHMAQVHKSTILGYINRSYRGEY